MLALSTAPSRLNCIGIIRVTYGLGESEAEPDGGVGEGHDRRDDGEPRHAVEVGYEGQHQLRRTKEQHVEVLAVCAAGSVVPFVVVAVGPLDRPATSCACASR